MFGSLCSLYSALSVFHINNSRFLCWYKRPLFVSFFFPIPLPWWHKKFQHQFVTARACTCLCVRATVFVPVNTPATLWYHPINRLDEICLHWSNQKVRMLHSKWQGAHLVDQWVWITHQPHKRAAAWIIVVWINKHKDNSKPHGLNVRNQTCLRLLASTR